MDTTCFSSLKKITTAISTLTEYLLLRYEIRNTLFPGLTAYASDRQVISLPLSEFLFTSDNDQKQAERVSLAAINGIYLMTGDEKCIVYFVPSLGVKTLKTLITWLSTVHLIQFKVENVIVIYEHKTPECCRHLAAIETMSGAHGVPIDIQLFNVNALQMNIFKNDACPSVTIVSDEDRLQLYAYYHIRADRASKLLPTIQVDDPVCRYLNIKPGELVQFKRNEYESYIRYVI